MISARGPLLRQHDPAAVALNGHLPPEHRARRGGAQRHHHLRPQQIELLLEPVVAGLDLDDVRLLMNSALAALDDELEVLDGVGDVGLGRVDAGLLQRLPQYGAGRSDKGLTPKVFLVARLLAD